MASEEAASSSTSKLALNPCCGYWKERCVKASAGRRFLRQSLTDLGAKATHHNLALNKALQDETKRADALQKDKASLEHHIASLYSSHQSTADNIDSDNHTPLLRDDCISNKQPQIDALNKALSRASHSHYQITADLQESLQSQKDKSHLLETLEDQLNSKKNEIDSLQTLLSSRSTKKASPSDKKKIAELHKNLLSEKNRADEAAQVADAAKLQSQQDRNQVEALLNQLKDITLNLEEANRLLETEKQRSLIHKQNAGEEKNRAHQELKRMAELNDNKAADEKCRSQELSIMFEQDKQKVEALQKELQQAMLTQNTALSSELDELISNLNAEREIAAMEIKRADLEKAVKEEQKKAAEASMKKAVEEKLRAESLLKDLQSSTQIIENLQKELTTVTCMLEAERLVSANEKQRADALNLKCNEQQKIAAEVEWSQLEILGKQLETEKEKADSLQKDLESNAQIIENLQQELTKVTCILEAEKLLSANEKQRADTLSMKSVEVERSQLDKLGKQLDAEKEKADSLLKDLYSSTQNVDNLQQELTKVTCMLEAEKLVSAKEKQRADALNLKCKEQRRIAVEVERSQLDKLVKQLEAEKEKAATEKKRADLEMSAKEELKKFVEANVKKVTGEKLLAEKLSKELRCGRKKIESLEVELNKVNGMLEAERLLLAKERNDADALKSKLEEQARIIIGKENREVCQEDNMIQELEILRQKLNVVEDQLSEVKQSRGLAAPSTAPTEFILSEQFAKVNLLQEQLKFEKKRVKHYKEVAKLENARKSATQQELREVSQEFHSLLQQMNVLGDTFSAINHINKKRRLNVQSLELPGKVLESSLPELDFCYDTKLRLSSLSSRDTPCHLKPNTRLVDAGQPTESPSGMKIDLDPLLRGSHGDILASSALNSNTASFSDEQLLGSQEREDDSLTTLTRLAAKDPDQRATIARWSGGERVVTVAENSLNPVELDVGHVKKRRKIVDEPEPIRYTHSQGITNQEADTNLFSLDKLVVQPMGEKMETVNLQVTGNNITSAGNSDLSGKKTKSTHEPREVRQRAGDSTMQITTNKRKFPALTTTSRKDNRHLEQAVRSSFVIRNQDPLVVSFEQELNGDYMKLLDLDDPVAEEHFRMAMECPLSPLTDIDLHEFDKELDLQVSGLPVCPRNNATDTNGAHDKIPTFCVVFSGMEDLGCITRIFCATRTCIARLHSPLQSPWLVEDILLALVLEPDLVPREKICVCFSLILLNFVGASCTRSVDSESKLSETFSAHLHSVLLNTETRHLFAKVCSLGDLLGLNEDFLLHKKILLKGSLAYEPLNCGGRFEILHQGENNILCPDMASTSMIVAGSILLASITLAAGLFDSICEFSLKIIRMSRVDCSMTLLILHTFAYVCGEEYFTNHNYYSAMQVVKYIIASNESTLAINGHVIPGDCTWHQFFPWDHCPFAGSCTLSDDLSSKLLKRLQECTQPHNRADTVDSSSLIAVLSSLELLAANMTWDWVHDEIVSKLFEMLESSDPKSIMSTAVVALLGDLGRLRVEAGGYDDPGVNSIVQKLSANLRRSSASKYNRALSMAIVHALIQLNASVHEVFLNNESRTVKGTHSAHAVSGTAASNFMKTVCSTLSAEQTSDIQPIVGRLIHDVIS